MNKWRSISVAAAIIVLLISNTPPVAATNNQTQGILITPARQYITAAAGASQTYQLSVANITNKPVDITFSVKQFRVADYTYDYTFLPVKENWITFSTPQIHLASGDSKTVSYVVGVPPGAVPGGHYFTLFASASLYSGAVPIDVQVTSVMYVTVSGSLIKTSSIKHSSIPTISFGGDIPFSIDVHNTGNTHFFVYASGKLSGWTAKPTIDQGAHIILPGTTRTVNGVIAAPLLPGIYTAKYGYKVDDGRQVNTSQTIVYLPPWAIIIPIAIIWITWTIIVRIKRRVIRFSR